MYLVLVHVLILVLVTYIGVLPGTVASRKQIEFFFDIHVYQHFLHVGVPNFNYTHSIDSYLASCRPYRERREIAGSDAESLHFAIKIM